MKKGLILLVTIAISISLIFLGVSCTQEAAPAEEEAAEEEMAEEETIEEEAAEEDELYIGWLGHGPSPYTEQVKRGAENAGKHFGINVEATIPSEYNFEEQLSIFESYIAKGVDGIALEPYPEMNWVTPIADTVGQGIPVFTFDITAPGLEATAHFGGDSFETGMKLAEFIIEDLNSRGITEGTIVTSQCLTGVGLIEGRAAGIYEGLKDSNFNVVGPLDSTFDPVTNYDFYENAYNSYPDMVAATGVCDVDGPSMAKHIEDTGADYIGYSFDLIPEGIQGLVKGDLGALIDSKTYLFGYLTVQAFVEHFRDGEPLPEGWIEIEETIITPDGAEEIYKRETDTEHEEEWWTDWMEENITVPINEMSQPLENIQYLQYFE